MHRFNSHRATRPISSVFSLFELTMANSRGRDIDDTCHGPPSLSPSPSSAALTASCKERCSLSVQRADADGRTDRGTEGDASDAAADMDEASQRGVVGCCGGYLSLISSRSRQVASFGIVKLVVRRSALLPSSNARSFTAAGMTHPE